MQHVQPRCQPANKGVHEKVRSSRGRGHDSNQKTQAQQTHEMTYQRALAFTLGSTLALLAGLMPTKCSFEWTKPQPQLALPPPSAWRWAQWLLKLDHRRGVPMLPPPSNVSSALVHAGGSDVECHPAVLLAAAVLCFLVALVACKLTVAIYGLLLHCTRSQRHASNGVPGVTAPDNAPVTPPQQQQQQQQLPPRHRQESPQTGVQSRREGRVDHELVRANIARHEADRLRLQAERVARQALRRQEQLEHELARAAREARRRQEQLEHERAAQALLLQRQAERRALLQLPPPPHRCCHPNKYNWGNQHGHGWKCPDCGAEGRLQQARRPPSKRCCHPNKYNWGNQHGRGWKCPDCGASGRR